MKKALLCAGLILLLSPAAFAAHALTIGSGQGSLSFTIDNDYGFINGSDATFDATGTGNAGTTVWNVAWMIYDVTNDAQYFSDDGAAGGFGAAHQSPNVPTGGSAVATSTSLTTTGITFAASSGLTADMSQVLSAPVSGDTARLATDWTFNNSNGTSIDLRVFYFIDYDGDLEGSGFLDDLSALLPSTQNSGIAVAVGNNSTGSLDLNSGVLTECVSHVPAGVAALSGGNGATNYWNNTSGYAGIGVEVLNTIDSSLRNMAQNDLNMDQLSDAGDDCGSIMQIDITVPATGSDTVTFHTTWGENQLLSAGSLPVELSVLRAE